jgi:hypothetical protein
MGWRKIMKIAFYLSLTTCILSLANMGIGISTENWDSTAGWFVGALGFGTLSVINFLGEKHGNV